MKVNNETERPYEKTRNNYNIDQDKKNATEKKIKEIEKDYEYKIERAKFEGDEKLKRSRSTNKEQLIAETNDQEEILNRLTKSLNKVKDRIEGEKLLISTNHEAEKNNLSTKFTNDYEEIKERAYDQMENFQNMNSENARKLRRDAQENIYKLKSKEQTDENDVAMNGKFRIDKQRNNFEEMRRLDDAKFQNAINRQKFDNEKILSKGQGDHEKKMNSLHQIQQNEYENQVKKNKEAIDQANKDFLKKYAEITENHKKSMELIKTESLRNTEKFKNKIEKTKNLYEQKAADPFYNPLTLNPSISENPKHYEISLAIPIYEKDNVQVSGKDKILRITFGRDYKDIISKDDGSNNKYSKFETYSKSIPLDKGIDSKGIEHKYENGVLTILVPKM
ncbi:MAG: Hsp20 family protein [Oligoflexia bacterium]|nr:Hsp20 family protein [Oligoflexia bacterium]